MYTFLYLLIHLDYQNYHIFSKNLLSLDIYIGDMKYLINYLEMLLLQHKHYY